MIQLREERPQDYFETETVMREAFWNHYTPACSEHYLLHIMRESSNYVPELALVASEEGKIVGGSMCMKAYIEGDNKRRYEVLSLGPIGVLPESQGNGIGGHLIARTKEIARAMGFRAILLCGDPDYYIRQGFTAAEGFGIRNAENMFVDALHACALYQGALDGVMGRYFEDAIYNVDEALVSEYDRQFPPKAIVHGTPTQKKFERMAAQVKPYLP